MSTPEISIIVPVYKSEKEIRRCVDSIFAQTFTDFELILVDDGSPDSCPEICDEYANMDQRVVVIHKENGGVSSARNAGIRVAKGEYLMFCDSDDSVEPFWCETLYEAIKEDQDKWVVSSCWRCDEEKVTDQRGKKLENDAVLSYFDVYKMGISAYVWNKIYRKKQVIENNVFFDETCFLGEDVLFNVQYYKLCDGIKYIGKATYFYYDNSDSLMHTQKSDWLQNHLQLFYQRLPLITEGEREEYCDIWLYQFIQMFPYVFREKHMRIMDGMRYNQHVMRSKEFTYCATHATGKNESKLFMMVVKLRNYYVLCAFQRLMGIKDRLKRRK